MLGGVVHDEMRLSLAGRIVSEEWMRAQEVRANVSVDEFVVMPNHLHGIIVIDDSAATMRPPAPHRGASTGCRLYPNSLGSIIGQFKSNATKRIWAAGFHHFAWQPRFHDHIIRSEASLDAIRRYIRDNPEKWAIDKDNLEGLHM
jgi:putative transposase